MSAFKTIALIGRHNSPDVAGALAKMGDYLRKQGRAVLVEKESAASNHVSGFPIADYDEIGARADLVVCREATEACSTQHETWRPTTCPSSASTRAASDS